MEGKQIYGLLLTELRKIAEEKGTGTMCKLGASVNYLYVGNVGDLIANLNKYQTMLKTWHKDQIAKAEANIEIAKKKKLNASPQAFAMQLSDKNGYEDLTWQNYQKYVESYFERIRRAYREVNRREERLRDLIPLYNRQVLEISDSIYEKDCLRIIIEGTEKGNYWATEEAKEFPSFSLEIEEETEEEENDG